MTPLLLAQAGVFDSIGKVFNWIMTPLYDAVAGLLLGWHKVLSPIFGYDSGWSWALSIVGLTMVIRTLLIPLFVRQIRSSRNMQLLQPKMKELQQKHGHDRERLGQEMMKLYKETGTNPLSSCMPLLLQSPVFLALFRVLNEAAHDKVLGNVLNQRHVESLSAAKIFGAPISDTFMSAQGPDTVNVRVITIVLIIFMTSTMFITQLQLMRKNMPKAALTGQAAQMQKIMLYVFPIFFLIGGFSFPMGVLIYWLTSNMWTMGQQFYVIRRNPAPGTPAYEAMQERKQRHGTATAATAGTEDGDPEGAGAGAEGAASEPQVQRPGTPKQPRRQSRSERKRSATAPGQRTGGSQPSTGTGKQKQAGPKQPAAQDAVQKSAPGTGQKSAEKSNLSRPRGSGKQGSGRRADRSGQNGAVRREPGPSPTGTARGAGQSASARPSKPVKGANGSPSRSPNSGPKGSGKGAAKGAAKGTVKGSAKGSAKGSTKGSTKGSGDGPAKQPVRNQRPTWDTRAPGSNPSNSDEP